MILKIDTTKTEKIKVELHSESKTLDKITKTQKLGSQVLLPMIIKILKRNKMTFKDLKGIEVNPGPGSFTGTRIGSTVANVLGFALDLPVNGKKGKIVIPKYEKSKFD